MLTKGQGITLLALHHAPKTCPVLRGTLNACIVAHFFAVDKEHNKYNESATTVKYRKCRAIQKGMYEGL